MDQNEGDVTPFRIVDKTEIFCDSSIVGLSYMMTQVRQNEL